VRAWKFVARVRLRKLSGIDRHPAIYRQLPDRQPTFRIADDPLRTNFGFDR
jgi:hypothetical protein